MSSNDALPQHAYYCFDVIHSDLTGKELSPPQFDAAEDLCVFFSPSRRVALLTAANCLLQPALRHVEHQVEKQRGVPSEGVYREL